MRVLILGYQGVLGQQIARVFSRHDLALWNHAEVDITDTQRLEAKIRDLRPAVIINCVAYNAVDSAEEDATLANAVNGFAVGHIALVAQSIGALTIHFSSDYVFSGLSKEGYLEDHQPDPASQYGKSKYLGEQELARFTDQFYLIRLSRLFGPAGISRGSKKSFVETLLSRSALQKTFELVDSERSCPAYSVDLAQMVRWIFDQNMPFGIYHASNSGSCTWYEFAREIFFHEQIPVACIPITADKFSRKAHRPSNSILLNTKLPAMRPWQEALDDFLKIL